MTSRQPSSSAARFPSQRSLPPNYTSIRDILDESLPVGRLVSVIGLVKDRRVPIPTGSTDWKASITIFDKSIDGEYDNGLNINIFRHEHEMPQPNSRDVVVVVSAKVQFYRGQVSLLTNRRTIIHVYKASKIPSPPSSAKLALEPPNRPNDEPPKAEEHEYVSWLYHSIDRGPVPPTPEFTIQLEQSANVKNKFRTLDCVEEGKFYDVIVNVVRDPFEQMDKTTLWISDYTENEGFFKFSWDGADTSEGRDGDPYGYTTKHIVPKGWPGPYGRRSMQVTCFGIHAEFINKEVKAGSWVQLRNLQVKYGHNASNLEGYLREDRTNYNPGLRVDLLSVDDPSNIDSRLKDAIRRKRDYEKAVKKQKKSFAADKADNASNGKGSGKRKAEDQGHQNSKTKRAGKRAQKFKMIQEREQEKEQERLEKLGLHDLIKCENDDQPVWSIPSIAEPIPWKTTVDGEEVTLTLPFSCVQYRANVRVVDFRPNKLEKFATWRKSNEYDMLSDGGDSSDSESESDEDQGTLDRYAGQKIWEWRFALQLEEADPKHKGEGDKIWVVVDNNEAQLLLNLDASDLRADPKSLDNLREQLFTLWGNLEECKRQDLQNRLKNQKRVAAQQPPDSTPPRPTSSHGARGGNAGSTVSNKPFACCIRQYGVKVAEEDPRKANAGEGHRWERVFGLFGTKI
ncbi:hypothetical protein F5Y04DRAFT_263230, partial [Hypomontagnella monticulosa]